MVSVERKRRCRDACHMELAGGLILCEMLTAAIRLLLHNVPFLTSYAKVASLLKRYESG